jgi:hypothetical protein
LPPSGYLKIVRGSAHWHPADVDKLPARKPRHDLDEHLSKLLRHIAILGSSERDLFEHDTALAHLREPDTAMSPTFKCSSPATEPTSPMQLDLKEVEYPKLLSRIVCVRLFLWTDLSCISTNSAESDMAIRYEHRETIHVSPEQAFAAIDNLPLTAKWLPPCVSLEKVGPGPNAPGDKLRYVYKQGGKTGEMAGEILARTLNERLHCKYFDSMFDISVDQRVAPAPDGALTTHTIEITAKKFMAKLMSPLIRLGLGRQTRQAAANLKQLLESGAA